MFAALAEEEPDEDENRTAEDEEAVFDRIGPVGGEEDEGIDDAKANGVDVATGEDDFLGKREITGSERILGAIVGVTEEFAIEDELENATDYRVVDNYNQANNPVNLESAIENLSSS